MRWLVLALLVVWSVARPVAAASSATSFPQPSGLRSQVEFWKKIFATYSKDQVVIHDIWNLDRVYAVLDFRDVAGSMSDDALSAYIESRTRYEKERIRAVLLRLHHEGEDSDGLTVDERRIRDMFREEPGADRFLVAAEPDRIRGQRGLRERFAAGIQVSRRYLPEMEEIFAGEGLPLELTRLPLVESCFNVRAYSKVGAAGVWQFMPGTGRLYLRIDDQIDERRDPISATRAAAALLRRNFEVLGTWPLAITAYNHGRAGMVRAVEAVGSTDIVQIIRNYQGPLFKFASRNFYAEFLAAVDVERHYRDYFGDLPMPSPVRSDVVVVPEHVALPILAKAARTNAETLSDLNPAFTPDVQRGKRLVPKGFRLRVPPGGTDGFPSRYAALVPSRPSRATSGKAAASSVVTHRVKAGQTLEGIARQYRTTAAAIRRKNRLPADGAVRAGQSLVIPTG